MSNDVVSLTEHFPPCLDDNCPEPQEVAIEISHNGERLMFGVCAEHARDIDWGVYVPKISKSMRGKIGRAAPMADIAG